MAAIDHGAARSFRYDRARALKASRGQLDRAEPAMKPWSDRLARMSEAAMFTVRGLLGAGLLAIGSLSQCFGQEPTSPDSPAPTPEQSRQLERWVDELGATEYAKREQATRSLEAAGSHAIPFLQRGIASANRERAVRSLEVLGGLYRQEAADAPSKIEGTLESLLESPSVLGHLARGTWDATVETRENRALHELQALGARVQYRQENELIAPENVRIARTRRPIAFIVISPKWRGGDEGLKIFRRLGEPRSIIIYHANGAPVSEEAMADLVQVGFAIERRGAYLGITAMQQPRELDMVVIREVSKDSPAERAGLKPGDTILAYDKQPTPQFEDLIEMLRAAQPGHKAQFEIRRDDDLMTVEVELGDW
jgi:hypothetical protein